MVGASWASDSSTVGYSAVPVVVSITIGPDFVDYGPMEAGDTHIPTNGSGAPIITNSGTVPCDLEIKGSNAESPTTLHAWTLSDTAGPSTYVHRASPNGDLVPAVVLNANNYSSFKAALDPDTGQTLVTEIDAPTDFEGDVSPHEFEISVLATIT